MSKSQSSSDDDAKKAAAYQAVADHLDSSYKFIGIGSGSTVVHVVQAIAAKGPAFASKMAFIPTGSQSKSLIKGAGLKLCPLDERPVGPDGTPVALDVAFDGADEVDDDLNCIKGGGACLFQEKLVAVAASKFIVVADYRKFSSRLCTQWKTIPIEILPIAAPDVLGRLKKLGCEKPTIRSGLPSKAGECVTDNGMWIIDAPFPPLLLPSDQNTSGVVDQDQTGRSSASPQSEWEVGALASELLTIPGVVEIGLFHGRRVKVPEFSQKPLAVYFGLQDGTVMTKR